MKNIANYYFYLIENYLNNKYNLDGGIAIIIDWSEKNINNILSSRNQPKIKKDMY